MIDLAGALLRWAAWDLSDLGRDDASTFAGAVAKRSGSRIFMWPRLYWIIPDSQKVVSGVRDGRAVIFDEGQNRYPNVRLQWRNKL